MDREELDRQLKEQGKNIELQTDKFSSGRKKLAAAAVVLLITSSYLHLLIVINS